MDFPPGTTFTYQAQLSLSIVNVSIDDVIKNMGTALAQSGMVILNSSYQGQTFLGTVGSILNPFGSGEQYQVTLQMQTQQDIDSGTAQYLCDQAVTQTTGNAPESSTIPTSSVGTVSGVSQTAPAGGAGPSLTCPSGQFGLFGLCLSNTEVVIIAAILILVVAVVLAPEAPARLARSFA